MSDKPILKENKSDTHLKSFSFVYNKNGFKKRFKLAFILPFLIFLGIMAFPLYIALLVILPYLVQALSRRINSIFTTRRHAANCRMRTLMIINP